jgi:LysR family transcriptional regulator for bpeEF and oprC
MDRLHAMRIFVRVVETGSFTRAAEALDLPKASVSQQVSRLESHLGVRLLQRTTRRVQVTEDGAAYYERALALLDDLEDLESSLATAGRSPRGRLRIDVPSAFGTRVLAPALPEFFARYPGIRLEVGSSDRPVDLLGEGVDCVIRGGEVHDESLIGRRLESLPVHTFATPGYLKRHGVPKHPDDLRRHALIGYFSTKTGRLFPYDFSRDGERIEIDGPFHVAFNDANTFFAAALAGLGIFQMPDGVYAREALETKRIRRILADWTADPLVHTILYPNRRLSARVQVFVDWALERLSSGNA